MKPLPGTGTLLQIDNDQAVPEDLVGRLYRATASSVLELLSDLSVEDRANLAMFCYRKSHLHRIGLAIAKTCDEVALVQTWGTSLGLALYTQSREEALAAPGPSRSKVTLGTMAGTSLVAPEQDDHALEDLANQITVSLS